MIRIFDAESDAELLAVLRARAESGARPPDLVHPSVQHLVPSSYSPGALGWTLPATFDDERDEQGEPTGRVVVTADDTFEWAC